jgi:hypothetical protein
MSQSSDSKITDISKETEVKAIGDILEEKPITEAAVAIETPAQNVVAEEKGIISQITSAADSLVNKITGATKEVVAEADELPKELEGESNSLEEEAKELDISKESPKAAAEKEVILKLGDIIYILDPSNEILNENTFPLFEGVPTNSTSLNLLILSNA